jgi:hypothetical protein
VGQFCVEINNELFRIHCCSGTRLMHAHILTIDEARAVALNLLAPSEQAAWSDTAVNMASASRTADGAVHVHLLGVTERHRSMSAFLHAYGIVDLPHCLGRGAA